MPAPKRSIEAQAQDHTEKAVEVLAEIMADPFEEAKDRIKAADALLDRGHGKPIAVSIQLPNSRRAAQLAQYSDEELIAVIEQAELPRISDSRIAKTSKPKYLPPDVIDAEFVPAGHKSSLPSEPSEPSDEDLLA